MPDFITRLETVPESQRSIIVAGIARQGCQGQQKELATNLSRAIVHVNDPLKISVLLLLFLHQDEEVCNAAIASLPAVKEKTPETDWENLIEVSLQDNNDIIRQTRIAVLEHFLLLVKDRQRFIMRLSMSDYEDVAKKAESLCALHKQLSAKEMDEKRAAAQTSGQKQAVRGMRPPG